MVDQILREKTPKAMQQSLDTVPESLNNMYEIIWQQLVNREEEREQQMEVIALLFLVEEPVQLEDLEAILNDLHHQETSLGSGQHDFSPNAFIRIDPQEGKARFIHASVREFLESKNILERVNTSALASILKQKLQKAIEGDQNLPRQTEIPDLKSEVIAQDDVGDSDDATSISSWSSGAFSRTSSRSSQSSIFSELETVTEQYAQIFANHKDTGSLVVKLLGATGRSGFEQFFSGLLAQYSKKLQAIAKTGSEQVAALMAGKKTNTIAHQTAVMSGFLDGNKNFPKPITAEERSGKEKILNRFLGLQDHDRGQKYENIEQTPTIKNPDASGGPMTAIKQSRDIFTLSQLAEEEEDQGEVYVNLQKVKIFLTTTEPFHALVREMQQKLQLLIIIPPLPPAGSPEGVEANLKTDMTLTWYSALQRIAWKQVLLLIPGGESPLEPGMKRVRWICVCGRRFYDDFYEIRPGAIRDMQKTIDTIYHTAQEPELIQFDLPMPGPLTSGLASVFLIAMISITFRFGKLGNGGLLSGLFFILLALIAVLSLSVMGIFVLILVSADDSTVEGNDDKYDYNDTIGPMIPRPGYIKRSPGSRIKQAAKSGSGKGKQRAGNQSESYTEGSSRRRPATPKSGDLGDQAIKGILGGSESSDSELSDPEQAERIEAQRVPHQQLWAIPIFLNSKGEAIAVHVDATKNESDYQLFRRFRQKYFLVSSRWQRFVQLHEVSKIQFVRFALTDQSRADVLKANAWPPHHDPRLWLYNPYPATEENIPLVGERLLRNVWQDAHHADSPAYRAWSNTAKWHVKFLHWLKHLPHRFCQRLRDVIASRQNLDDESAEISFLPQHIHPTDVEQPEKLARCKRIFRAMPKKIGEKIIVDFRDSDSINNEGWGLEFQEMFRVHRLLFFILVLYACGSLVVTMWLLRHYDLGSPSALGPLLSLICWLGSLLALTCTVWFKWAENPNLK